MKKITTMLLCLMFAMTNIFAQGTKSELEKAQKSGKTIFLIVKDKSSKGTDALLKVAEQAKKNAKNTEVVKLDRDDKANSALISKYRLAGAPLPLILVVASNNVVSVSLSAGEATSAKLLTFIPSKNQADVLLGFENGKAAFIICGKKNTKDKDALMTECKAANASIGNKANVVFIDIDSKDEANFIALLNPDKTKTTVLVFNGKGQYTATSDAKAKSKELIAAVNKKIANACCLGGSASGCGKK
ncbi:MAG: hypothetical protein ACOYN4_21945 [Bacteroidales bacterium]